MTLVCSRVSQVTSTVWQSDQWGEWYGAGHRGNGVKCEVGRRGHAEPSGSPQRLTFL